jgi:hypothetical protein
MSNSREALIRRGACPRCGHGNLYITRYCEQCKIRLPWADWLDRAEDQRQAQLAVLKCMPLMLLGVVISAYWNGTFPLSAAPAPSLDAQYWHDRIRIVLFVACGLQAYWAMAVPSLKPFRYCLVMVAIALAVLVFLYAPRIGYLDPAHWPVSHESGYPQPVYSFAVMFLLSLWYLFLFIYPWIWIGITFNPKRDFSKALNTLLVIAMLGIVFVFVCFGLIP